MRFLRKIIVLVLIPAALSGWGEKGHKIITKYAMKSLPAEMNLSDEIKNAIVEHSTDADKRKKYVKDEYPKHFIDIDYYEEFVNGNMITSYDELSKIYGEKTVTEMGVLPWATMSAYSNLVDAFKQNDKEKIILYASDISHYVEDGHQPQHTTLNYNGEMTNQKGVHFRYESDMFDKNAEEIENNYYSIPIQYVSDISDYIFNYVAESNSYNDMILAADRFAYEKSDKNYNENFYRLFWFKTKHVTFNRVSLGASRTASLIYSAWIDAGKPVLK
jgi:hypothetical protein